MHTISIDANANLVTVQYQGKVTVAERTEVLDQLLAMLNESQYRKLLVDFRHARTPVEDFRLQGPGAKADGIGRAGLPSGLRLAF